MDSRFRGNDAHESGHAGHARSRARHDAGWRGGAVHAVADFTPAYRVRSAWSQRTPVSLRAMTRRWISLVPS